MYRRNPGRSAARGEPARRIRPSSEVSPRRADLAVEHVHQGSLARAVFADQRVNLAGARLEIDAVERERAPEALGYGGGLSN